ncbi:MAG: PilZ domain-containing protein [Pseudorhodoplanes sp.]|jgi:hypothetical protein|nr:PilZ domain-containing protein [Pseudorhodoplanes sp.]
MPDQAILTAEDVAFVDRRSVFTTASIAGRYWIANKRNLRAERREFACRTLRISPHSIALTGPVKGPVGERVIAHFDEIGKLEGRIIRLIPEGFVMSVMMPDDRRARLAAKIDWLDKHRHYRLPDDRKHKRMIPKNPHSTILLADGTVMGCFVIDMSVSGVAVSADITPQLGDVLAVGKIIGRVARLFPEGFAMRFVELQDPALLEPRLIQS